MLVQPKKAIGTRALLAPEIPGAKLLPGGKWAINRAAALLNFPALGLKVQLPVWSNKKIGDKVELLLNNVPVDQQTVTQPAEQTQRTTLFVAPGRFQTGAWELAYRVTRVAQQPEPFAPPLQLAVKLDIPAGQDTNPEQGHSNLHMAFRPPEIVQDGVDKDTADKGVDIVVSAVPGSGSNLPYPEIAVGDVIIASWGGKLVASAPVTQAQIDDPLNNPIVVHISKDIILAAGDSGNEGLAVSFLVRDFVDNDSEDWCKEARIVVDTGNSRLDAPILKQADGNELDLDQLGNEQLLLQVVAASSVDFKLGDIITMHLQGTTLDGDPVAVDACQSIKKNPPLVVEVPMDNDGARALAKTQGVFFFDLERDGRIIQRSRGRFINMKGEPKRLAAPIVESAVSGALDPDLANVIVRFPFDPLITDDNAIELLWSITLADGTVFEPELDWIFPTLQEANDPDGFIVIISGPDYLKPGEGGTLKVSYNLLSEGENDEVIRRPSLPAAPLNIGEPRLELVPPILLGEQDGALEPKDLPNGISEVTCPNPVNNPTLPKDVVHWQLHDASNKLLFEDHKPLNALSAGKPVKFPLNAAFVQQYFEARRGEQLSVRYHIVRDATDKISYSNPLVFVVGEVVELVPPTIDSVKGLPGEVEIPDGGTTVDTMVKLSGAGAKGQKVQIKDGTTVKGEATVNLTTGLWELTLTGLSVAAHSFTAIALYGSGQVSAAWTLTVTASNPPTITKAIDSKGATIAKGGFTVDTQITLSGGGAKGQKVQIKDGTTVKGEATVNLTTGLWELTMTGLSVAAHNFTAIALYGSGQVSAAWTLTVTANTPPTITKAIDSKGNEIAKGGFTVDTQIKLSGAGAKGQKVQIKDGTTVKGEATVNLTTGLWELTMTGLSVAAHSFTAIALYGSGQISAAWTLTVTANVAPTITQAVDSKGAAIAKGGSTVDTTVKLSGAGAKGQKVQIKDGTTVKGEATVNLTTGLWELTMTGLSVAAHSFTAIALYGSGQISAAWTLTVTANVAPTITQAVDSKGAAIAKGGSTVDTTVKLSGAGAKGQKVQIKDGDTVKGEATVNLTTGLWELTMTGLSVTAHSFTATGLYGAGQVSTPWTLTVTANVAPTITQAVDSKGAAIAKGGSTVDTTVKLSGAGAKGQKVQIKDGTTVKGEATVNLTTGLWELTMTGLSVAAHSFTAIALYGSGQISAAWTLTVTANVAPTITQAVDSKGAAIPPDGTTFDTTVTLKGKGAKGQKVLIKDGNIEIGTADIDPQSGDWVFTARNLSAASHRFTATALYGSGEVSDPPRVVNVASLFTPRITMVTDSKGTVNPGATTYDTSVTVSGEGPAGQQLQIYNNDVVVGPVITVETNELWSLHISGLSIGGHSLIARALYPVNPVDSQPRTFTVAASITKEDFESESKWTIYMGQTKRLSTMEITAITSAEHYMGTVMPYGRPGVGLSGGVLFISKVRGDGVPGSFNFRIRFLKTYRRVDFWYEFAINQSPNASAQSDYFDSNGRKLGSKSFNAIDGPQQQLSFSNEGIASMEIRGVLGQHLYFDKFELYG